MQTLQKVSLEYSVSVNTEDTAVIIVAAGSASRMQGVNKIFLPILKVPVIVRTVRAFETAGFNNIIVVTKSEDILKMQNLFSEYNVCGVTDIVEGGATRGESVLNGIKQIKNKKYMLIHDGARPLIKPSIILKVRDALNNNKAAVAATRVTDTIKKIDENGNIVATVNRDELLSVQTPQGFLIESYLDALKNIDITKVTDDCAVLENAGISIYPIIDNKENIKITTKEDILLAEAILKERGE